MKNCFDRTPHTMKDWLLLAAGVAAVFAAADWLPGVLRGAGAFLGLLAPFGWGLLLAYVLDIPTRFFAQKLFGGRRGGAMAVSYALFFGALALLAALAVCGIGILFSILIVLGMDIYRKHTYTSVILPDAYRITDMKATAHTSYSVNGSNTDYVYIITVKYEIDGTSYTDTLQILQGTHFATELHARYLADNAPEEVLGNLYYSEKDPSHIGRYGDDSLFVE